MLKELRKTILPVLIGLGLLALIGLAGAVLTLVREAAAIHPALGIAVGLLSLVGAGLAFILPVARVLTLPRGIRAPETDDPAAWQTYVLRYARRLVRNPELADGYDGIGRLREDLSNASDSPRRLSDLEHGIGLALDHLDGRARTLIGRHAAAVFASTAVSQSGRLDTVIVLATQLRMVREVAGIYVQRPGACELLRLYANVGASAFAAGELQDTEVLALLGAPVTAAITGMVPISGTDPIDTLLVNSLLDGSANAFLTLRVGTLARRHCGLHPERDRGAAARGASLEAAELLAETVGRGAARMAAATRKLLLRSALQGPGRAARGVAGFGGEVVGKMRTALDRTARHVGRQVARPPQWVLRESVKFWEGIVVGLRPAEPGADPEALDDLGSAGDAADDAASGAPA